MHGIGFHTSSGGLQILVEVRCNDRTDPVVVWSESSSWASSSSAWARDGGHGAGGGGGARRRRRGRQSRCWHRGGASGVSWKTLKVPIVEFLAMPSAHTNGRPNEVEASALNNYVVLAMYLRAMHVESGREGGGGGTNLLITASGLGRNTTDDCQSDKSQRREVDGQHFFFTGE